MPRSVAADPGPPRSRKGRSMTHDMILFTLGCILLIPFAAAGLGLIHQGLGRSRSAAHAMVATLCAFAIAAILTVAAGFSFAIGTPGAAHSFAAGGAHWDWLGRGA